MIHGILGIEFQSIIGRRENNMYGFNPYQQNYPQSFQNNFNQQNGANQDERIWVSNQQAAESYLVAANGFVRLWDSSQSRFYEKSADCTGRPMTMRVFEYKEVSALPDNIPSDYVSAKEFAEFKSQVNDFISSLESKEVKKNAKQSNANNATA